MNIYVAGSSAELERAERWIKELKIAGINITHDWTLQVRQAGRANAGFTPSERRKYASDDLDGVVQADLFWLLFPVKPSKGCWVELGAALVMSIFSIVSQDDGSSIFTADTDKIYQSDEEAYRYILTRRNGK